MTENTVAPVADDDVTPVSSLNIPLGKQIAIAMAELGWGQKDLSAATGIAQPNISRWVNGIAQPSGKSFARCMEAIVANGGSVALDAANGVLGIFGRTGGALEIVDLHEESEPIDALASVNGSPFIARGYTTLIAGEGGGGKTLLTQTIGAGLANGDAYAAGMALNGRQNRVLFIDAENGKNLVLKRKEGIGVREDAYHRYQVAVVTKGQSFDLKYDFDKFRAVVEDAHKSGEGYDLVVLDSLVSITTASEQSVNDMRDLFGKLDEVASNFGCAVLVIHHTGKDGVYRGTSAIQGAVTCGLFEFTKRGKRDENGEVCGPKRNLHCAKMRIDAEPKDITLYVAGTGVTAMAPADYDESADVDAADYLDGEV